MPENPYFQVESGADPARFELAEGRNEAVIGRSADCEWVIPSGAVSRRHAIVRRIAGEVTIEDLGSSNGTFVNGERLAAARALRDQDRVQLGAVDMRFVLPAAQPNLDATVAVTDFGTMQIPQATIVVPKTVAEPRKSEATGTGTTPTRPSAPRPAPPPPPRPAAPPPRRPETSFDVDERRPPSRPADGAFQPRSSRAAVEAEERPSRLGDAPSAMELAIIAAASFLVVFAVGAILIRYVF